MLLKFELGLISIVSGGSSSFAAAKSHQELVRYLGPNEKRLSRALSSYAIQWQCIRVTKAGISQELLS